MLRNKGNVIEKYSVSDLLETGRFVKTLKSIKPIKNSWTTEEIIALCKQAYFDEHYKGGSNISGPMMSDKCSNEEWIKENL